MKKLNGFFVFLNIVLLFLTLGAYLAPYFHPSSTPILAILGLGFPALIMANIIFILYWLLFRPTYSWMSILTLLLGLSSVINIINFQPKATLEKGSPTLQVANYNMQFSKPIRLKTNQYKNVTDKKFRAYLEQFKQVDILCIQEHSLFAKKRIDKHLQFPYKHFSRRKYVAIYSKFPIIDKGEIKQFSSNIANACIWADIDINGEKVRIYSAHFESNRKDGVVPDKIVETAKESPVNTSIAFGLLKHYKNFSSRRATQAKKLSNLFKESPYPVILGGDVNDTPQSHVYKLLKENRIDTFRERGFGLGATFGSTLKNKLALLRIDYIFTPPSFKILDHQIYQAPYSDHYLITSTMQLP